MSLSVRLMHILEAPYLIGHRDTERDAHQSYALGTTAVSAHFWADDLFHCYHSNVASATCVRACAQTQNTSRSRYGLAITQTHRPPIFHSTWSTLFNYLLHSYPTENGCYEHNEKEVIRKKVCVYVLVQICVAACLIPLCKRSPWLEEVFTSRRRGV